VGVVGMESEMAEESPAAVSAAAARARPLEAVAEEGQEVAEQHEVAVGSTKTMERVAAAKKFIEDHYRAQMKNLQERKERYGEPVPASNFFFNWSRS
jgi:serine/threonine kinase 38